MDDIVQEAEALGDGIERQNRQSDQRNWPQE
jgi:hypothetical protein